MKDNRNNLYIQVYIINTQQNSINLNQIKNEFKNKNEFKVNYSNTRNNLLKTTSFWKKLKVIIDSAIKTDEDVIILCKSDHKFTQQYNPQELFNCIFKASSKGIHLLLGGVADFNRTAYIDKNLYWIDSFRDSHFIIIFKSFFQKILEETFHYTDDENYKLSILSSHKAVIFPFISIQKKDHYSTLKNNRSVVKLKMIEKIRKRYVDNY